MTKIKVQNQHLHLTPEERGNHLTNRCLTADVRYEGFYLKGWRNEVSIDVEYNGPHTVDIWQTPDNFEIDLIVDAKPSSNVFTYDIETKGLDFLYQPELSQEDIDDGCSRPDNVVGSYAVYHSTKVGNSPQGNYRTGKAFHIYRPEAWDSEGTRVWCDLEVKGNKLTVTVPQDFLDDAVYPITVDPNFGFDIIGGSDSTNIQDQLWGLGPHLLSESGIGVSMSVYSEDASGEDFAMGVYDDDTDYPDNLLRQTVADSAGGDGWQMQPFTSDISLTGSVLYWFGVHWQSAANHKYDTDSGFDREFYNALAYTGTMPNPFPAGATNTANRKYSAYFTYKVAETATFTSDAQIGAGVTETATFNSDSHISAIETATFTSNAAITEEQTGTFTSNSVIDEEQTGTFTSDSSVFVADTGTFTSDANVFEELTGTFNSDANVFEELTGTFTSDSHIAATETGTFTSDAEIVTVGVETGTFISDAHIATTETATFISDAIIDEEQTGTFTSNSHISTTETATFTSDSHISTTEIGTFNSDSHISTTETDTFTSDAEIAAGVTETGTFNSDAHIAGTETGTFTSDAQIGTVPDTTVVIVVDESYDEVDVINESYDEAVVINESYDEVDTIDETIK